MFSYFCATGTRRTGPLQAIVLVGAVIFACVEPAGGQTQFYTDCFPSPKRTPASTWSHPSVDLFAAIERGVVEARMIVRDQYHARLMLTNRTDVPQAIQIPDVLGARPILAQQQSSFFGPQSGSGSGTASAGANATQSVGGTPQGSSSRNNRFGSSIFSGSGMNNVFNIAPEQVRTVEIKCLCLEQGKPNPRSAVKYELVPLAEVNDDPKLAEVLKSYGRGEANREVAQAAAWHLANEMTWVKLAALSQKIAINADRPWFSTSQLQAAKQLVNQAEPQAVHAAKQAIKVPKL